MKKIAYILLAILSLTACQSTTQHLGEQFEVKNPITVDAVLEQLKTKSEIKDIQVEGKIEKSCMSEGCWFTIKDAAGNEVLFDIKDKKFRVPINSPGKNVVVLADAYVGAALSNEGKTPKNELLVKGLLFK